MRHGTRFGWVLGGLGLFVLFACQPAGRHPAKQRAGTGPSTESLKTLPRTEDKKPAGPQPLPTDYAWMRPTPRLMEPEVPIRFVHQASQPEAWAKLPRFWNDKATPSTDQPPAFLALQPATAAVLAVASQSSRVIEIRVPLGLPDPTSSIPAINPPTLGKWELGKRLFFDGSWLQGPGTPRFACATCHQPERGFSDGRISSIGMRNTPTLINCVFNRHQFWDGRVDNLEEVVQRTLEDEREPPISPRETHVWTGAVERLRAHPEYSQQFKRVFGTPPTQDALGKALATYLRTILSGESLHDQAEQARQKSGSRTLESAHYAGLLDDATLKALGRDTGKNAVAQELLLGRTVFREKARCALCHPPPLHTDHGFHNLGVGDSTNEFIPGQEAGRFAHLRAGLKDAYLIGAYKTPTLRALPRTAPYFHDGLRRDLDHVVVFHAQGGQMNPHLDPAFRDANDPTRPRHLGLSNEELHALILFLQALDGAPLDPILTTRP